MARFGKYILLGFLFLFASVACVAASVDALKNDINKVRCSYFNTEDSTVCFVLDTAVWGLSDAKEVSVAGTFNSWKADAQGYVLVFEAGSWVLCLPWDSVSLPGNCGRPEYKFVVDGKYLDPPAFVPQGWRFDNAQPCMVIAKDESDVKAIIKANKKASKVKALIDFKLPAAKSKSQISNFRRVPGTTYLYRTYHPFKASRTDNSTELFRLKYAVELATEAGISSDICLSGDETDSLKSYMINRYEMVESIPDYYRVIIEKRNVLYLGEDYEIPDYNVVYYGSDTQVFNRWIKDLVAFIIDETNPVPMSIHCRLGTDRTGVFCAVLAALCGASWDEISKDYAASSDMGIGEYRDPLLLKYSLDNMLQCDVSEVEDLQAVMSKHFIDEGVLTADDIVRLRDRLN